PQLLRKIISQVQEYQDLGYNIELSSCFPNCISRQNTQNCFAATVSCALNSLGQLSPCRYSGVWSTLNLVDHNLEEVWQDLVFKPWREYKNTKCESCPQSGLCYGGCKLYEDDPLIYPRNMAEDQIVRDVVLEEGLRPLPLYKVRQEPFGILLMREDRVIPVSEKAAIVLKLFDGEHTLKDIKDKLGFGVIPFIYSLHMRGFVKLQEK
ncbi:SPASM domain-containing protein, partial [bacterium]|nr:SPASM domain-containing protein [bacterium]